MSIPEPVLSAYGVSRRELHIESIPSLINPTYVVRHAGADAPTELVLQRLHPVFGPQVHFDIEAATHHLAQRGVETPRLIRTLAQELWTVEDTGGEPRVWRALTYIEGVTVHQAPDVRWLVSAATLLARFHRALADLEHEFLHRRPLHDTLRHRVNLETVLESERARGDDVARALGGEILAEIAGVRLEFSDLPGRILHGDPKLSNVMFGKSAQPRARCMIDLDTLGRGPLAHELGDALRSWCNPAGEDADRARIDTARFEAVLRAYAQAAAPLVSAEELASALEGLETISLELSSRFAADAILDTYFGWDPSRFATRREHNLVRARGQLALFWSVRRERAALSRIVERVIQECLHES